MTAISQTADGAGDPGAAKPAADPERRAAVITACVVGGIGCAGVAVPIVASFGPSEREKAAGGPVDVDITSIPAGQMRVVEWQGKPIWVLHRSAEMIASLKTHDALLADPYSKRTAYSTPAYVLKDPSTRSIKPPLGLSPSRVPVKEKMDIGWPRASRAKIVPAAFVPPNRVVP